MAEAKLEVAPVTRTTLALFAGASGDHNPMHIDLDFARAAGRDDVFAHGMLVMAYAGRLLTNWVPQSAIREFNARFTAITNVHEALVCSGAIVERFEAEGERRTRVKVTVANAAGEVKLAGEAVVVLD